MVNDASIKSKDVTTDKNGIYKEIYGVPSGLPAYIIFAVYSTTYNQTLFPINYSPKYIFPAMYQGIYEKGSFYSIIQLFEINDYKLIKVNTAFNIKIYYYFSK